MALEGYENLTNWFNDPRTGQEWVDAVIANPIWSPPPAAPPSNPNPPTPSTSVTPSSPVPTPPPAPLLPTFIPMSNIDKNFKVAPSDIIQFNNDAVAIAQIQQLFFEDIGAIELANISRSDLIDGQNVIYEPVANLSTVNREFNPNNIIANSGSSDYFSRFGLDISSRGTHAPYFDESGNLIIEIDTVNSGEELQVEILSDGTITLVGNT